MILGALAGVYGQIHSDEDIIRDRAVKFLAFKLRSSLQENLFTPAIEEYIITESKKVTVTRINLKGLSPSF